MEISSDDGAMLCSRWLDNVREQLGSYEDKLLVRHVPSLPKVSLERLVAETSSAKAEFLESLRQKQKSPNQQKGSCVRTPAQLSKMQTRRILQTALGRSAEHDDNVRELHGHWEATQDKSARKGRKCACDHWQQLSRKDNNR